MSEPVSIAGRADWLEEKHLQKLLAVLSADGERARIAGGAVRNALLGQPVADVDIATTTLPEETARRAEAAGFKPVPTGIAHGTVTVVAGGKPYEVTTLRADVETDGRRAKVAFGRDWKADAERRDFTINGLFADPLDTSPEASLRSAQGRRLGRVIDYVGGVADLEARVIRAIGDPDARFAEDYLRMLRAVRFASRLGFTIEPKTAAAIRPLAKYLGGISRERIGQEVAAMLMDRTGEQRATAIELMQSLRLDGPVLNEDHRDASVAALRRLAPEAVLSGALAAWMLDRYVGEAGWAEAARWIDAESPRVVERWRNALCLSNQDRDVLRGVLRLVGRAAGWAALPVAQRKRLLAEPLWPETLRVLRACGFGDALATLERDAAELFAQGVAPPPLLNGEDLIALGLTPGPAFGRLLEGAYDAQLEGALATREAALAWVRERAESGA